MKDKMMKMSHKLAVRKAEKKGAASLETIIVSGLLIALAVGLIVAFSGTLSDSGTASNKAIAGAVNEGMTEAAANQEQTSGEITNK